MFTCPLFHLKLHFLSTVWLIDLKAPGSIEIHWIRQYLVNFTGLAGIVNATLYNNAFIYKVNSMAVEDEEQNINSYYTT